MAFITPFFLRFVESLVCLIYLLRYYLMAICRLVISGLRLPGEHAHEVEGRALPGRLVRAGQQRALTAVVRAHVRLQARHAAVPGEVAGAGRVERERVPSPRGCLRHFPPPSPIMNLAKSTSIFDCESFDFTTIQGSVFATD